MRIAVLSDLHLGDGGPSDRFAHDDGEFLGWLRRLEADFERVVLLGDVWETLTPHHFGDARAAFTAARAAHPELAARFERPPYLYVHGNHDLIARRLLRAPGVVNLAVDGVRLMFTHGHVLDAGWRHHHRAHQRAFWLVGWIMRAGLRAVVRQLDTLDNWMSGVSPDPARCPFQAAAAATARVRDADVIVTGHTHLGGRFAHGDRLVLNSGACSWGRREFLEIDTRAGVYALRTEA